ncbi:hypothetical protein CGLAU_02310 [Corynebacterium glaucum]|uniref:Anti-sigma-D factor RsdA sigma factor binding region domain-containing protein n=1 Tax=Corynebacterium glaucum TaxID=187491 RepID=A0A1Q2HUC1_9CORY|nr:hypothetical protein [Corynebacterium glaucum]AQQ14447.1 hypothetical protein CGLAU_02310 [Corynebacterium glaucum]
MTRREEHHSEDAQSAPVAATDAFLDALARGEDPSNSSDPLAALLLDLKTDIDRPIAADHVFTPGRASGPSQPASLDAARQRREQSGVRPGGKKARKHGMNPWAAGLVGAAAASTVLAGAGAALYNATPDSALWGPATTVFGERAAAVELATTLKQLEVAKQEGDEDHANELLRQARELVETMKAPAQASREGAEGRGSTSTTAEPTPKTTTVTVTVTTTPEAPEPEQSQEPTQQPTPAPQPPANSPAPAQGNQGNQPVNPPAAPAPVQPRPVAPQQPSPSAAASQANVSPAQPSADSGDTGGGNGGPGGNDAGN